MHGSRSQSYSLPVVISVVLHATVIGLLLVRWPSSTPPMEIVPPHVIAEVIQVENTAAKERRVKAEKQRKQQELAAKEAAERKKQEAIAEKQAQEEAKKVAETKKQQSLKEQKLAKEAKQKAEKQERLKRELEQDMQEQIMREQAQAEMKAQQQAKKQGELAASITADFTEQIRSAVQSMWRYPSVVRSDQEVTLAITLVPTGEVVNVQLLKSSGNPPLDRSVEQAVYKASPLPVPKDMQIFEKSFRKFTMKFRPENATW